MELNHDYLKVSLDDIWENEVFLFLRKKREEPLMKKTFNIAQSNILKQCSPDRKISKSEKRVYSDYETRLIHDWDRAQSDFKETIKLNYFIRMFEVYTYNHHIEFDSEDSEYLHFFILKLSQYNSSIGKVQQFLSYQRCLNKFESNIDFYNYFLPSIWDFEGLINSKLQKVIELWKDSKILDVDFSPKITCLKSKYIGSDIQEDIPLIGKSPFLIPVRSKKPIGIRSQFADEQPKNKKERDRLKEFNSFKFKVKDTFKFVQLDKVKFALHSVFVQLCLHKFISKKETSFEEFLMLFMNLPIPLESRVKWLGNRRELKSLIKILRDDLEILDEDYKLHYFIAIKCFRNPDGVSYLREHLSKPRDKEFRYQILTELLMPLKGLVDNYPNNPNSPQV